MTAEDRVRTRIATEREQVAAQLAEAEKRVEAASEAADAARAHEREIWAEVDDPDKPSDINPELQKAWDREDAAVKNEFASINAAASSSDASGRMLHGSRITPCCVRFTFSTSRTCGSPFGDSPMAGGMSTGDGK